MDLLHELLNLEVDDMVIINGLRLRVTEVDACAKLVDGKYEVTGNHVFFHGEQHKYHVLAVVDKELTLERIESATTLPSGYRVLKSEPIREVLSA